MKKTAIHCFLLLLTITNFLQAQTEKKIKDKPHPPHNRKSNYICDSLFNLYTNSWLDWWTHTLKVKGPIPGKTPPAHFSIPYSDLQLLDSLGHKGVIPDSVEAFYAFNSEDDLKANQVTAVLLLKDSASFKKATTRWKKWAKSNIKGEQPVGFKIRFADLDSMYHLLDSKSNPIKSMTGYFGFHSEKDKITNRMVIIFRPVFKGNQTKISNSKVSCGKSTATGENKVGESFINIDFTNPCPPCNTSG